MSLVCRCSLHFPHTLRPFFTSWPHTGQARFFGRVMNQMIESTPSIAEAEEVGLAGLPRCEFGMEDPAARIGAQNVAFRLFSGDERTRRDRE